MKIPATIVALTLFAARVGICAATALETGIAQAQAGNCGGAIQTLTPLVQAAVKPAPAAYGVLADCQLRLGRLEPAVKTLRDGLKAYPAAAPLQRSLGEILFRQQADSAEAGELLRRAATALPSDPESRHYYAQWAYLNFRDRVCVEQERAALRLPGLNDPALLQMNTLLGLCAGRLEDAATAKRAFQDANRVNQRPGAYDPVAAWHYLQFLSRSGEDEEAQEIARQILDRVPRFGPALLERAKRFERLQEPENAIDAARLTLAGLGNDINIERAAHGILARSYFALGRAREAEAEQAWIAEHPNPETKR